MMRTMSQADWIAQGEELFGKDRRKWKFVCSSSNCKRVQSYESVMEQYNKGEHSQRYGENWPIEAYRSGPEDGTGSEGRKVPRIRMESTCYSPTCNWVAGGLFSSGKLIVVDPKKPYNEQTGDNCFHVFWFEGEETT